MFIRRLVLFAASLALALTLKAHFAHAEGADDHGVLVDYFEMPAPCNVSTEKALNANPECYTVPQVQIGPLSGKRLSVPEPGPEPTVGDIVNLFQWFWKFVEDNKAVVNVGLPPYAAALPQGKSGEELDQWEMPRALPFKMEAKNGYGMNVVSVVYQVQYTYGGRLNGHGRYLNNVTVVPREVHAAWGYRVDLSAKVLGLLNFGTKAEPIAGIQLEVEHMIQTQLKKTYDARSYVVRGDGKAQEVMPNAFSKLRR